MVSQRVRPSTTHGRKLKVVTPADLRPIVEAVTRRAERQGYILAREVREELANAGVDEQLWRSVLQTAGTHLAYRQGRYYFVPTSSPHRQRQEAQHQAIRATVHDLVEQYRREASRQERREADRISFIQPAKVEMTDGQEHHVLTKDISASGIRLLGSRDLLGQKIRVRVPSIQGPPCSFLVRIIWTCRVGDDLYENGGVFLEVLDPGQPPTLRLAPETA
jgi:hypothetical protein